MARINSTSLFSPPLPQNATHHSDLHKAAHESLEISHILPVDPVLLESVHPFSPFLFSGGEHAVKNPYQ